MLRGFTVLLLTLGACAAARTPQARYASHEVAEAAVLPPGYERGDSVRASCSRLGLEESDHIEASLDDFDCSFARLTRILKARAGERAARVIFERRCRARASGRELSCTATIARPTVSVPFSAGQALERGPAPSPAEVLDLDEPRPQDGERIQAGFARRAPENAPARAPRLYDSVAETSWPTVGLRDIAEVSASCKGCDAAALHHALRVTAGRVGAHEISNVRCFPRGAELACIASAFGPWSS